MTKPPRAAALRKMLGMLVEHRRARAATHDPSPWSVERLSDWAGKKIPPRWVSHIEHAKEDPIAAALYAAIREEGWRAYAEAGLAGMHALCAAATEGSERLAGILDHRWNGIGTEAGGFWVA